MLEYYPTISWLYRTVGSTVQFSQKAMKEAAVLQYYDVSMCMTGKLQDKKTFGRHVRGWERTDGFAFAL